MSDPPSLASRYMSERSSMLLAWIRSGRFPRRDLDQQVPFRRKRLKRYADLLAKKAEVLLAEGSVEIITNAGILSADLLTFEDGSRVIEFSSSPGKIPLGAGDLSGHEVGVPLLVQAIKNALESSRVRPTADQQI